jgi:hypothetical protein
MRATVDRDRQPFFCPHVTPGQGLHQHTYYVEECQLLILNRRPRRQYRLLKTALRVKPYGMKI